MIYRAMFELLTSVSGITAIVPANRWYNRSNVPDTPEMPFVVLAWNGSDRAPGNVELLDVYVHDERGSYLRIKDVLSLVRATLSGTVQYVGTDGGRIALAEYLRTSGELFDDATNTNTQFSSWNIVGR